MRDMTYEKARKNADALKALGDGEVYLTSGPFPWHLASRLGGAGSHRLDIATAVWFYADDPDTGLSYRWTFDIEPYGANGKGSYEIDVQGCRDILVDLNEPVADDFRRYLLDCSMKVAAKGLEYQEVANRQAADAAALRRIATETGD